MPADNLGDFTKYLLNKNSITGDVSSKLNFVDRIGGDGKLRDLWELTDLSANDFADEVARFYRLPRVTLPALMAASSLASRFSRRFLRETAVFPYEADGRFKLALADPSDGAAMRAAEIVLGGPVAVEVALLPRGPCS